MRTLIRVGLVGCGTIGREIAKACQGSLKDKFRLVSFFDIDQTKYARMRKICKVRPAGSLEELVDRSSLIVEAANARVPYLLIKEASRRKKDIMIMSVGGLIGHRGLLKKAEKSGINVYLPSGAIAGIDALKSAACSKIDEVILFTRKPPKGLEGAPYIRSRKIDLKGLKKDKVVFKGSASDAVKAFPKNINVSAILSIAGIGAGRTQVRIIASPGAKRNVHEIIIRGKFGVIKTRTENVPSPYNPKTSYLAALSAVATLRNIAGMVKIGT